MTLLQMSFSGALMILVIAALRFLLQRNVHRDVWIFLWFVVVLRLILPFSFPAVTSFYNLSMFHEASAQIQTEATEESTALQTIPAETTAPQSVSEVNILKVIWLSGAALVFMIVIGNHLQNLRCYRTSLPCTTSLPPLPKGVQVRTLDNLDTPLTYGLFKPTILLPARFPMSDTKRLNHVLQHELSHIRNRDILTKLVLIIAAAIHWFNPLVWLMVLLASQDMEMRCDAQAVSMLGNERIAYARSLVAAEEDRICGYLQAGFSHSATERRILALTKDRAIPVLSVVICVAMLMLLSAVFMTGQAEASLREIPPPAPVEELQETALEEPPVEEAKKPPEDEVAIFTVEANSIQKSETDESDSDEPEPQAEEEPAQEDAGKPHPEAPTAEEITDESEDTTQNQAAYTSPAPAAPSPEPYIEPPSWEDLHWERPPSNNPPLPKPPTNYDYLSSFPVFEVPDPGPKVEYPTAEGYTPGLNITDPLRCIPG